MIESNLRIKEMDLYEDLNAVDIDETEVKECYATIFRLRDDIEILQEDFMKIFEKLEKQKKKREIDKEKIRKLERKLSETKHEMDMKQMEYNSQVVLMIQKQHFDKALISVHAYYRVYFMALAAAIQDVDHIEEVRKICKNMVGNMLELSSKELIYGERNKV